MTKGAAHSGAPGLSVLQRGLDERHDQLCGIDDYVTWWSRQQRKGEERVLAREQNDWLRRVTGAYKSTPIPALESLTHCLSINLLPAKQTVLFEERATGS